MSRRYDEGARGRILSRITEVLAGRDPTRHPGVLPLEAQPVLPETGRDERGGVRPDALDEVFELRFERSGGAVVQFRDPGDARGWLREFARDFESVAVGKGIPDALRPALPEAEPRKAELGVSMALGAAARTGSLLLSSREGRGLQVLPPAHLVWVPARALHDTLCDALESVQDDLPAVLALHSGPSKSADIGRMIVKGVHGPGRVVAALVGLEG